MADGNTDILIDKLLEIRRDAISTVLTSEDGLRNLGRPVPTAIRTKEERKQERRARQNAPGAKN